MKWISVSEKLPELTIHENEPFIGEWDNSEPVLVYHSDDKWECKYLVAQYTNGFADVGEPILYGWVDINDGEEVKGVLAWMPLPQPYTADRKDENSSEKPNNCDTCKHNKLEWYSEVCDGCSKAHSNYEPQTFDKPSKCLGCLYSDLDKAFHPCASCVDFGKYVGEVSGKDEPQTEYKRWEVPPKVEPQTEITTCVSVPAFLIKDALVEDEPQTERKCIDCNFLTYMFGKTWCNIKCDNPHDKVCDRWTERSE